MNTKFLGTLIAGASLIGLVAFIALTTVPLSGCVSTSEVTTNANGAFTTNTVQTLDTNRVDAVAGQAAIDGTIAALQQNPSWLPQFQLAANDLNTLANDPTITLNSILVILQGLPIKQLKSQTATLSFEGAKLIISLFDVPQLPSDAAKDLQAIARATAAGINQGIQQAAPAPPVTPASTNAT